MPKEIVKYAKSTYPEEYQKTFRRIDKRKGYRLYEGDITSYLNSTGDTTNAVAHNVSRFTISWKE